MKRKPAPGKSVDSSIALLNRQRTRRIDSLQLRRIVRHLLKEMTPARDFDIVIHVINATEMTRLNENFLQHAGSTDVITFDHRETVRKSRVATTIHGELFVCVDDAIAQAREFKTNWQSEVVRYIVHGVLHLLGYDDLKPQLRRTMKREENRLVRLLADRFALAQLARTGKISA